MSSSHSPASPTSQRLALVTLCTAVLVAQVDTSVVNLAVRPIGEYFHAGVTALQWVVDSYNLTYAVLLLSGGLIADLYGRRRALVFGAGIFAAASALCGFAPSIAVLTVGRALTGIGSALLLPASLAMIRVVWPEQQARARALGVWAACNGIAFVVGPTLGGVLIRLFDWRAIFLLVVPLGLASIFLAFRALPESADPHGRAFDGRAQILGAVALGGLAVAAIETHGDRVSAFAALVIALVALFVFVRVERERGASALVPLDIFAARTFSGAVAATACMTFGMYGVLFLMPLTWQSTGRLDALHAGLALIPMATVFALVSPVSGHLRARLGASTMTAGGGAIIGAGVLVLGFTAKATALWPAQIGLMMTGLGMGLATGPLMEAAVGAVATARSGTAAALINVARMSGATLGVALLGTIYAFASGGTGGLQVAMLVGGVVQLAGAAIAAVTIRTKV